MTDLAAVSSGSLVRSRPAHRMDIPALEGEIVDVPAVRGSAGVLLRLGVRDRTARREVGRQLAVALARTPVVYGGAVCRGAGRVGGVWWRWVTARDVRTSADAAGRLHDRYADIRALAQSRVLWTCGSLAAVGIVEGVAAAVFGAAVLVGSGVSASAVLATAGRRPAHLRPLRRPLTPTVALTKSVPLRYLEEVVRSSLAAISKRADDVRVYGATRESWGWTVTVQAAGLAVGEDKIITALERHLQVPVGSITPVRDRANASLTTLRIVDGDPLADVGAPPHHKPGSLTITKPLPIGRALDGSDLTLSLLRVHAGLIGGTGSGKSSTLWTLLDGLTACRDAVVWGIDLTDGPMFNAWGDCIQNYATTENDARALLERALAEARRRAGILGKRSRPNPNSADEETPGDENWTPTPDEPALVIVIDELPVAIAAGLMEQCKTLQQIGRKSAITLLYASTRAGKEDLGSTTNREMLGVVIMLPCAAGDVDMLMPRGRAEGWRPDRLIPSDGITPNDAGRFYIRAGGHIKPMLCAGYRLTLADIHHRAIERMRAGLPALTGEPGSLIPPLLAEVVTAMDGHDPDTLMPTAELLAALPNAPTDRQLAADMTRWGCGPERTATTRGYRPTTAKNAVARILAGGPTNVT